jgi:ATP-dependent helicase HrpB
VVLCTNIAETSLTIESISTVIDSGLERVAHFDLKSGVTRLKQTSIAQSSAVQRAGRAGRVMAGRCVRLYSEAQFNQQQKVPKADILTSDLSSLLMELAYWGESEPSNMAWIDAPPSAALDQASALLQTLDLIDDVRQLTEKGKRSRQVGSSPRLSAMLVGISDEHSQKLSSAVLIAALCEESHHLTTNFADTVYAWQTGKLSGCKKITQRAQSFAQRLGVTFEPKKVELSDLGLILSYGYPDRICRKRTNGNVRYLMANGHGVELKADDPLTDCDLIIAIDLMRSQSSSSQLFSGAELVKSTLVNQRKSLLSHHNYVDWDEQKAAFVAEKQLRCGELVLERTPHNKLPQELKIKALLNVVKKNGLSILNWSTDCEQYQQRVLCAAQWCTEFEWPDFSNSSLIDSVEVWLAPYINHVSSAKALKSINIMPALNAYLAWPLNQELDKLLPTHWVVPTGSKKPIRYIAGHPPILSVRMQEMFGEKVSPSVASGRVSVTLELLSPAQRPLQVTQDLAGFWSGSYIDVKKEMKGRYPKHVWPDDPANHIATKKTKRHFNS